MGINIPIPFSEETSPGIVRDRYINIPNKKRLIKIIIRPSTNCNFLFLNLKIAINAINAVMKKNTGTNFARRGGSENKSRA